MNKRKIQVSWGGKTQTKLAKQLWLCDTYDEIYANKGPFIYHVIADKGGALRTNCAK